MLIIIKNQLGEVLNILLKYPLTIVLYLRDVLIYYQLFHIIQIVLMIFKQLEIIPYTYQKVDY